MHLEQNKESVKPFPRLSALHERHRGVTPALATVYEEAASVCLSRYHTPPTTLTVSQEDQPKSQYSADWRLPTARERAVYANQDHATEKGAYGLALGAAEVHLGLVAVGQAEGRTGADYYLMPLSNASIEEDDAEINLEDAIRLEISGIDRSDDYIFLARLRHKIEQTRRGKSNLPALAGVVAFNLCRIGFRRL